MPSAYIERRCLACKQEFDALAKEVKRGLGKFCSRSCASQARGVIEKGVRVKLKRWSKEEDALLLSRLFCVGYKGAAKLLGRSDGAIRRRVLKLKSMSPSFCRIIEYCDTYWGIGR